MNQGRRKTRKRKAKQSQGVKGNTMLIKSGFDLHDLQLLSAMQADAFELSNVQRLLKAQAPSCLLGHVARTMLSDVEKGSFQEELLKDSRSRIGFAARTQVS